MAHPLFESLPDSPLVTSDWLAAHRGSDNLVVLDATVLVVPGFNGQSAYLSGDEQYLVTGHIPGAVFADVMEVFSDPEGEYPFTRPSRGQFEHAARTVGVDSDSAVVVYDNAVGQWASRLWWLFRAFGYDDVRVLDGGLKKWVAEGRAV
ncbi:rhodanese-like domain-containing protein, partial [Gryllotalpicola sp.]|uniref:sulfurtransferase n=1 Tax=Gryllotalpicola sp. TaxID=1932787 RepID=UPI002613F1DC